VIREIDDLGRVGERRITHPQPHQLVPLDGRIAAHLRVLRDQFLPGDRDTASGGVENEAVIAALDAGLDEATEMQRCRAMTAAVGKCGRLARAVAKQHDRIAADSAGERLVDELVGPRADIPSIA
jgi:bacterioferritin-associated ferredoxin